MAGQAGRQADKARRALCIILRFSFTLSARLFFNFFLPSFISQFYIRPDIEIKQTSSGGRSLSSFALLVAFLQSSCFGQPVDPHWEKERCVCGLIKLSSVLLYSVCVHASSSEHIISIREELTSIKARIAIAANEEAD
jgi:hypothetical protein